jgi:chromosome segregation protein
VTHKKGLHPGATWKKADFQIHTPRDVGWTGPRLPGGTQPQEQAREDWADGFVDECVKRGLSAIAITDHHDFTLVPYVQRAIGRKKLTERLWLFPGIEATCDDSVQCLVLFDQDTHEDKWQRLFGGHLQKVDLPDPNTASSPAVELCGKNVDGFIEGLSADQILNDCSIVLPHGSDSGAHKSMIRVGFHKRFKELPFDGVYTDKPFTLLDPVTIRKIFGEIPEWGTRRRGILPTGDNRTQTYDDLGKHNCWIRLGEPTTESIRQALLADLARIAYEQPTLPSQRILELHVSSSLCGTDFRISFNDGFTALIGGRGSGKSAILEYLRFGIGRSSGEVTADEDGQFRRERQLIADTLNEGYVEVTLERDGVLEVWRRDGKTRDSITVTPKDSPSEKITIADAQERFRARAFSQKQLSTLVLGPTRASEQMTGIAAAESLDSRKAIEQQLQRAQRDIASGLQRLVEFWIAEAESQKVKRNISDLKRRIAATKAKLDEVDLSATDREILAEAPTYNAAAGLFKDIESVVAADLTGIEEASDAVLAFDAKQWPGHSAFDEVNQVVAEHARLQLKIREDFQRMLADLKAFQALIRTKADTFKAKADEFRLRHASAVAQQASIKDLLQENSRLEQELQLATQEERRSEVRLKQLSEAPIKLGEQRTKLAALLEQNQGILADAAQKVSEMSNGLLKAQVKREAVPMQYVGSLVELCENQRVRELSTRCEDRVQLAMAPPAQGWKNLSDELLEIYKYKVQTSATTSDPAAHVTERLRNALFGDMTEQQVNGIYNKLSTHEISRILIAVPVDFISFEYRDAANYIPFEQASPGQQAAALLNLLLNQEAGTLIIDQPEDDLDNRVIMEIVKLVRKAKRRRQVVFATHNANFVVNGDADKVIALTPGQAVTGASTARIYVEVDGAIETPEVRSSITDTIEGGKAAFELRSRKYLFNYS